MSMNPAPFRLFGEVGSDFDQQSLDQLTRACTLPVSVKAALMPDAHVGYGLPIGGVLATRDAVIPYAVGVDIACRMKMTVLDIPAPDLDKKHRRDQLARAIETETCFGVGGEFPKPNTHAVMDLDWSFCHIVRTNKDKAWRQIGTSGSGNHFVEFGKLTISADGLGLDPGEYVALLSHSGSRGTGAAVCEYYSRLASANHPELGKETSRLAWLDLASQAGGEYWAAMNLMGEYAAANHAIIHKRIARHLGVDVLAGVETHHNFAWKEKHTIDGREEELIVHRKGATPAGVGALGVIPGSMGAPGFVVRGLGFADSLNSASHGAGRQMSRTKAREAFRFGSVRGTLEKQGITVLSAGSDESPGAYKDIHQVMARQTELVQPIARFDPAIVKMAPEGERAED